MAELTLKLASLVMLLTSSVNAQFVTPPQDLTTKQGYAGIPVRYKEVPTGICELDPSVKSYAGYADVGTNEHLWFWFFEARNTDPTNAPLTVWINGGPGASSMLGLFTENGPCTLDSDFNVYSNPYSWSNVSNMLYIDQPVTVGLSYTEPVSAYQNPNSYDYDIVTLPGDECPHYAQINGGCATFSYGNATLASNSTANAAPNMWKALQGFMGAFPQYSRNGFHFTTESYGGHYAPIFNEYFESQNAKNIAGAHKISLESVMIGNGWYDPLIQYQAFYNFTVSPGNTYDFFPFNKTTENQMYNSLYGKGNCVDQVQYCASSGIDAVCSLADAFCASEIELLLDNANRNEYDIRELYDDPYPPKYYSTYMNMPKIQQALGAYTNYSAFSTTVGNAFGITGDDDREDGTIEAMSKLLDQGVSVIMYTGDADNCNWLGGEVISQMVGASGFSSAGYTNITTSDHIVHGQVKQSGKFAFVRIYYSGHEVPFYQPLVSLEMFERVITGKDIATGKKTLSSSYKTVGTAKSTFREGNSTVQYTLPKPCATYNTTTNEPNKNCPKKSGSGSGSGSGTGAGALKRSSLLSKKRLNMQKMRKNRGGF